MNLILSLSLILAFIFCYILMIQIFTVLFRLTGLTREKARFQVISLLTNSGYTTNESELITNNRSRRKIAKFAMISGTVFNVVIASLFINILITINSQDKIESLKIMGIAIGSFVGLMIILRLPFVKRGIERLIEKIITKIKKKKMLNNIITVMDSYGKKSIVEVYISHLPKELEGKSIEQSPIRSRYNINILTIQRNSKIVNVKKDTMIQKGDRVVMFGNTANIRELFDFNVPKKEDKKDESLINKVSIVDNYGSNALVEVTIRHLPENLKDKTLLESKLKEKYDINVVMLKHDEKAVLVDANSKLSLGDKVVLMGPYEHIEDLFINEVEVGE